MWEGEPLRSERTKVGLRGAVTETLGLVGPKWHCADLVGGGAYLL